MLYNFLKKSVPNTFGSIECYDHDNVEDRITNIRLYSQDSYIGRLDRKPHGITNNDAKSIRLDFISYSSNERQVSWQLHFIY